MNESDIEASLNQYQQQLADLDAAWEVSDTATRLELDSLRDEMRQLVKLTEESLLSFKKSKLLSMIDENSFTSSNNDSKLDKADINDEYALFQAELEENEANNDNQTLNKAETFNEEKSDDYIQDLPKELRALEGTQCRVPFEHHWGQHQLHNAMIMCAEPLNSEEPKVRVMFSNPTHRSMLPCHYYLDGRCNFDAEDCRFSHGYVVSVNEIQDYVEPNFSSIKVGSKCMACCDSDKLWHSAVVVDVLDDCKVQVKWDRKNDTDVIELEKIWPMEMNEFEDSDSSSSDDEDKPKTNHKTEDEELDDELPVFLWKPPDTKQPMAEWEKHTTGIGSRLMKKMGYSLGEGLGRDKSGRAEPVPIQLLPQGKSLDKIMELKEIAGDRDLYDAMKAQKRKQKQIDNQAANRANSSKKKNVFDFINHKLSNKNKDNKNSEAIASTSNHRRNKQPTTHITKRDLDNKSDKHISLQICQTDDEIRVTERKLSALKSSLKRNEGVNQSMVNQFQQKIKETEGYLNKLKTSQSTLESNRKKRTDHKKLSVF